MLSGFPFWRNQIHPDQITRALLVIFIVLIEFDHVVGEPPVCACEQQCAAGSSCSRGPVLWSASTAGDGRRAAGGSFSLAAQAGGGGAQRITPFRNHHLTFTQDSVATSALEAIIGAGTQDDSLLQPPQGLALVFLAPTAAASGSIICLLPKLPPPTKSGDNRGEARNCQRGRPLEPLRWRHPSQASAGLTLRLIHSRPVHWAGGHSSRGRRHIDIIFPLGRPCFGANCLEAGANFA